jgi:hypothetical protein
MTRIASLVASWAVAAAAAKASESPEAPQGAGLYQKRPYADGRPSQRRSAN